MDYYVPEETEELLRKRAHKCKNLGLLLDKYIPISVFEKPDKNDKNKGKTPWLARILEPTNPKDKGKEQNKHLDAELAQHVYQRWLAMTSVIGAQHFQATLDWRMVVGLGGETVLETDLTLHHLYGIPYVPASALKGLTRAYVTGEVFPSGNIEDDNDIVKQIFGTQKEAGTLVFFDAMPVYGQATFVLDIMNPHYPDYYRSKQNPSPPTNDQNPNPVTFLTVTKTTFAFALAPRNPADPQHQSHVNQAIEWLEEALEKYGVGGKTSAGYGYFKNITELASSTDTIQAPTNVATPPAEPKPYVRPNIPVFRPGQDVKGSVIAPTNELRQQAPADARAFLSYESFAFKDVIIAISAEEAQNWKPGETRICQFVEEQVIGNCTVLVCQPRPGKKKKG